MKTQLLLSILLLSLLSAKLLAQTVGEASKPVKTGNEWKMPIDVFKRSQAFADDLKQKLGLDSIQTKKVYEAFLNNTKPSDEISVMPDGDVKKAKMKANQEAFKIELKGILSLKQYDNYLKMAGKKNSK